MLARRRKAGARGHFPRDLEAYVRPETHVVGWRLIAVHRVSACGRARGWFGQATITACGSRLFSST